MDDIILAVANALPRFNDWLLRGYTRKQINGAPQFIASAFREATRYIHNEVKFIDARILSPEERVQYELGTKGKSSVIRTGAPIAVSEMALWDFQFEHQGRAHHVYLYIPYLKDDVLVINDTRVGVQRMITEQIFSRTNDGVRVRVMRAPLSILRNTTHQIVSATLPNWHRTEFLVVTPLHEHQSKSKKKAQPTLLHYLLCYYGLEETLKRFGLSGDDLAFVPRVGPDVEQYNYFVATGDLKNHPVYLKVRHEVLENATWAKLVVNLLYICTFYSNHSVKSLYDGTSTWRVYMGRIIRPENEPDALVRGHTDRHIFSVSLYLDHESRERFAAFGVRVTDFYEFLCYVFVEIERIMVTTSHQNLFNHRVEVFESILIQTVIRNIYPKFYKAEQAGRRLDDRAVGNLLRLSPVLIKKGLHKMPNVVNPPSMYNDNWLIMIGLAKQRQTGARRATAKNPSANAPESRFHSSIPYVESMTAFSGKVPGMGGFVNPFLTIDEHGGVVVQDYVEEIVAITKYLPHR